MKFISNYATMRFEPEALHDANAGLDIARDLMEKVKQEFPWISYGDLWTLAGVVAIQVLFLSHVLLCVTYFFVVCYIYRKWLAPRFLGVRVVLTVLLPRLHQMDVSPMLLRAQTTLEVSSIVWGT